uniref:ARS2 domain-containing protein n=1 Tax=Panagrellus redivivus TaxID=6233 RepID=A0A7E4W112_PANRE
DIAAARTEPIVDDAITELLKLNTDAVNGNKQAATTEGTKLLDTHKTTSIFFKNIPTSVSIQQLEEVCKGFPGFLRLGLSDPVPEAKFAVIKLEGGSDEDIAAARTEPIVDDAITELLKLNTDAVNGNKQAATTEGAKLLDDHKTTSIFFKNIPTSVSIQQLEEVCKGFPGFLRLWLSDPVPEAKFGRRAFASFRRDVRVKKIFWGLKGQKIGDVDLGAAVNRDIKRRVRWVNGLTRHRTVAQNDLKLAAKLVVLFDYKNGLYKGEDDEAKPEPPTDLELAIARSKNPVLENITEFLIEEANAEEDVLLGLSESSTAQSKQTFEVDEEMLKTLDKIVLYLRIVYSFDFYGHLNYPNEDSMPNKLGIIHVRGVPPAEKPDLGRSTNGEVFVAQSDIDNYNAEFEAHIEPLLKLEVLSEEDLVKLGKKDPEKAVEEFIEMNTVELGKDKWLCPLSGKKFKGAEIISLDLDLNLENDNAIVSSSYFKTLREHVVRMIPFGVAVIQTCSLPNWSA